MENIDYITQLGTTLAFALTFTQVVKPGVKDVFPGLYKFVLPLTAMVAGIAFQFRTGIELPLYVQFLIDGTFGGILAAGGYSLVKK